MLNAGGRRDRIVTAEVQRTEIGPQYVELSATLGERLAVKPRPGEEKAYADALVGQLRADGLIAAAVPFTHGGPGLSVRDLARVTFNVARQSGSAGLIYAMHMSQAVSVVEHGKGPFFEDFMRRMVRDQILIASGTSEKGPGGDILHSLCTVEPGADGQFQVTKESPNISYIDHAGAILVSANHLDRNGKARQVLILAEAASTTFTPGRETSFLGMKGILNRPYALTSTFPAESIFPQNFGVIARSTMTPVIHILWASLWSGMAWAALDKAKRFVAKEIPADSDAGSIVRVELTRLANRHFMMNVMIRDAIATYDAPSAAAGMGFGSLAAMNRLKICCSELLEEICQGALKVIGIRGYAAGGPYALAETMADALSASIMVSNMRLAINTSKLESFVEEVL